MASIVIPTSVIIGDPDLVPGNVKKDVEILGTSGALIPASGNAVAADLLAGKTAANASGPITGGMVKRQGAEYPGYERAVAVDGATVPGRLHMYIPKGAYIDGTSDGLNPAGNVGVFADSPGFTASNIKLGADMFGLTGQYKGSFIRTVYNNMTGIRQTDGDTELSYTFTIAMSGYSYTDIIAVELRDIPSIQWDFGSSNAGSSAAVVYDPEGFYNISANFSVSMSYWMWALHAHLESGSLKVTFVCNGKSAGTINQTNMFNAKIIVTHL